MILAQVGLIVLVTIMGINSGLTKRSDKISSVLIVLGILIMTLGHRSVSSVGVTGKYNQLLEPKWDLL